MLTGAYSDKYKLVQQDQVQQLRTHSARKKEQDRAKTLRQETLRRRKALEDKKKHDAEKEAKRREQELAKRRERQQEATEKFQRAHVRQGSARGRKSRTPTLDEVLRQVRGTSRASPISGTATTSGITNTSARTVFSRKYGGSHPDLSSLETGAGPGLQYGKLTAEMRTTSERNLASSKKMFEQQLEEQNRLLAEQQQRTIKELHEEVEHLRRSSSLSSLDSLEEKHSPAAHHPAYRTDQAIRGITVDSKYTDPNYVSQGLYAQGTPATRAVYDVPYGQDYSSTLLTDSNFRGQAGYQYQTGHDTNFQANGYSHIAGQQQAIVGRPRETESNNAFSSATSVPTNSGYSGGVRSFLGVSGVGIQNAAGSSTSSAQQRLFSTAAGERGGCPPSGAGDSSHHAYVQDGEELQVEEANELVQDTLAKMPQVMTGMGYGTNTRTVAQVPYSNPRYRLLFSQKKAWGTPTLQAEETAATPNSSTISSGAASTTVTQSTARMIPTATTTTVSQTTGTSSGTHTNGTSNASSVSHTSSTRPPTSIYSKPLLNYSRVTENAVTSNGIQSHANGYSRTDHDRDNSVERHTSYMPGNQGRTASGAGISIKGHAVNSEQHGPSAGREQLQLHDTQKRLELLRQEREAHHMNGILQKAMEEDRDSDHQSDVEELEEESEPEPPKPKIIKGILKKKSKYESHPSRPFSVVITGGRQIQDSVDLAKQEKKKRGIRWVDLTYDDDDERKNEEKKQTNSPQLHVGTRPQPGTQTSRPTATPEATAIHNRPTRLQTGRRRVSSAGSVRKAILARAKAASRQGSITIHANDSCQPANEDAFVGSTLGDQGGKPCNRQLSVSTCSYSIQSAPSQPQASTQMPRKVENTKQSNTQIKTENENEIYSANGLRLDKTPTDDEINWLWDKVRSCLNQRPDRAGMETAEPGVTTATPKQEPCVSGSRQTAQMSQLTLDGGRLAGSDVVPKLRTMPRVGGITSTAPAGGRRRTASDSNSASIRRNALLQQRNQQRANTLQKPPAPPAQQQVRVTEISQQVTSGPIPSAQDPGNRTSGPSDSEVTESLAAFLEAEYMSDQPISEAEIAAALDAMHSRQTGQKAPSALSMEEQRLLQSLDRLNQRLKVTETVTQNASTNMPQKPPLHPGTRNVQSKPRRVMSATTMGPRYHFRTGSADTNTRTKKNYVYQ